MDKIKITGNEPAMPFLKWNEAGYGDCVTIYDSNGGKQHLPYTEGLTIRQQFAAMAMQALIGRGGLFGDQVAREAIKHADDLIDKLNEE
jgi:hypothetical protein